MIGLFELLYYLGYKANTYLDIKREKRLPSMVVSVGNITTGGTGKTPLTIALAEESLKRGYKPAILTRGYKGRLKGPILVASDMKEQDVGDEALLMAKRLKGVPVIKGADRYKSGMGGAAPFSSDGKRLFILDDGYQHRRLFRDVDVLLINAVNPFGGEKLLPVGNLREPVGEIKRADVIVITSGDGMDVKPLMDSIRKYNRNAPVFAAGHEITHIIGIDGKRFRPDWISGKRLFVFCGIGEPEAFISGLRRAGGDIAGSRIFRDHHRYNQADIDLITGEAKRRGASWIITTEKDIMRLEGHKLPDGLVYVVAEFAVDKGFYDEIFRKLAAGDENIAGGL